MGEWGSFIIADRFCCEKCKRLQFGGGGAIATIKDVAKLSGVSIATVSRTLNGSGSVKEETRRKINEAIEKINYQPNFLGRNLRLQQTKMVLVILNSIANDFYSKVVKGIEEEGRKFDYHVMLCATHDNRSIEDAYIALLKNKSVDGIIFMKTTLPEDEFKTLGEKFNIVQCSEYIEDVNVPYVSIDNFQAAYDAITHLIGIGRRRIAHITVEDKTISSKLRYEGYVKALADHNLPVDHDLIVYGKYGYRSAYTAMESLLRLENTPDAVFAISDRMAAGSIKCLMDYGLSIPGDVAVVGFDNTDLTKIYNPTITTVSQSQSQMGSTAMHMLIDKINGAFVEPKVILQHKLIVRQTSI